MTGQRSPIDPTVELADTVKALAARVAELERAPGRIGVDTREGFEDWATALAADYAVPFDGNLTDDFGGQGDFASGDSPTFAELGRTGRLGVATETAFDNGIFWDGNINNTCAVLLEFYVPPTHDDAGDSVGLYSNGNGTSGQHLYLDGMTLKWESRRFGGNQGQYAVTLPVKGLIYCVLVTMDATSNPATIDVHGVGSDSGTPSSSIGGGVDPRVGDAQGVASTNINGTGIVIGRVVADASPTGLTTDDLDLFALLSRGYW